MVTTGESAYRVIGTRPVRPDGADKVTGRARYGADVTFPRMLHARLKRSPYAHALIKRIDASKALALPGVEAVVIGTDFPGLDEPTADTIGQNAPGTPRKFLIGNFLAVDKALYFGHPVAAVAATTAHIAEDALDLIEVEYEELPPVMSALEAMEPNATILHDSMRTAEPLGPPSSSGRPTNVAEHLQVAKGDVESAWARCDLIVEREFHTDTYHQGYIEPQSATAYWNADGTLVIHSSSQGTFITVRDPLAGILQMPASKIRVVPMEIGGGFGGKTRIYCEPIAALLAKKANRPVRLTLTRDEVMQATGPTSGTYIRVRLGATNDGKLVAAQAWMAYEAGAFPGSPVGGGVTHVFGNYDIEHILVDGYDVLVNRPRSAPYRAPGVAQTTLAVESLIDELAERLDMDGMELRLMNASREGYHLPTGVVLPRNGNIAVMEAMQASQHYRSELSGPHRGRGVAVGFWTPHVFTYGVNAFVNQDGTVTVNAGAVDIGGLRATQAMTVSELLGIPYHDVRLRVVDTDSIGYTGYTAGSGTALGTTASVIRAVTEVKERLIARASQIWGCDASEVTYDVDGSLTGPIASDGESRRISFKELAGKLLETGGPVSGHADDGGAKPGPSFSGHIVDVEVDPETGKTTVLRYSTFTDVGKAMHPSYVEGQIQGGASQGIGMALTEEYFYDDAGVLRNSSLLDYRMPTALDLPMIETTLIEVPNPGHPFGARGVGEIPIVPPLGAVANAIYHATGIRPHQLPASPRVLLESLLDRDG